MRYDLNLLRVFDAVMAEGNVSAAANRLNLSQSAVSAALSRLRATLGDELFVRARYGVIPTDRAVEIAPVVALAIAQLDKVVLESSTFDPATAKRRFTVAASAYFECVLIPQLVARMAERAPSISMGVSPLTPEFQATDLAVGKIDIALGRFAAPPENLVIHPLMDDDFVCLVRRDGTAKRRRLSKRAFEAMKHVIVAPPGQWRTGLFQHLEKAGLSRTVLLSVSHFLAAPVAVAETGACATLPRRVAQLFVDDARFYVLEPPVDLGSFPIHMAWHPRFRRDQGHQWLRTLIQEVREQL